ncbi:MAG TPA: UDP binding domain-containing protein, partial [Limnochordia bacterium]
ARPAEAVATLGAALAGLDGRRVAVWGFAFKPGSGDTRGAQAARVASALAEAGVCVRAYDPAASLAGRLSGGIEAAVDPYEAVEGADALAILTPWPQFAQADWRRVRAALRGPIVFDPWGCAPSEALAAAGLRPIRLPPQRGGEVR